MSSGPKGGKQSGRAQVELGQKREGTHNSDEPVSKITWDSGGGSSGDVTHIEHLHGEGGSGLVQNWLPFLPTLLPPSGCQISLEINL